MIITIILIYLAMVNTMSFALFGIDKRRAVRDQWRIAESTLLSVAFAGGSIGAFLGMRVFHHKTRDSKFRILVPAYMVLHIAALGCLMFMMG